MKIDIIKAVEELKSGNIVALPTETVYGLGAIATNIDAIKKIYKIKNRPQNNPLICHIHSIDLLEKYVYIEDFHKKLFSLWPGPLTILFKKKDIIPDKVTANSEYCAFRIPNHPLFLEILKLINEPIAAPSANPSGKISPVTAEMVIEYFNNQIPVVDGGKCQIGLESTVIKVIEKNMIQILRPGKYTKEYFEKSGFFVIDSKFETNKNNQKGLLSPGLLPKHYAPKIPLILLANKYIEYFINSNYKEFIIDLLQKNNIYIDNMFDKKVGFLVYGKQFRQNSNFYNLSIKSDLEEIARNLFSCLKEMEEKFDIIISFEVENKEVGIAINDRLKRAAEWIIP
ncbi:MAG: threonylcarbamoyl-AMP synthase [Leptospiraceae bacterium]|nr:MAG: threonylcarbamoyl-AMP synthase [Leptospiraceae bacterium]